MKLYVILPVIASLILGAASPALAQTSPQPEAQQPAVQGQPAPAAPAKATKAKHQKMTKKATAATMAKRAKAKAATPAGTAPADQD
ncbi:endoglucanase/outer membrane protein insertion porin family [Rhizobiales bacterium GAS191]|jgi:hypothetical protein|nr:endoglucanase/outer membrane protein insertion porin family [Rhizobiales bacterium GAS113]SED69030.1 endoglucanase/outer membrane protein insertion porin family [Rhizobiales bacterium GAS188]SEE83003.1 endoglucanase/outer membrane protein insertion porin family [Rhizobiales bacterium GAS191]